MLRNTATPSIFLSIYLSTRQYVSIYLVIIEVLGSFLPSRPRWLAVLCGWRHGCLPRVERCASAPLPHCASRLSHPDAPHAPNPTAARAEEIDLLFYERCKVAEALRDRETRKAVRLQSAHRGRALRLEVAEWNAMALVIERCARGHLGRQQARRLRIERDTKRQRSFFDALATTVQKRFRAYHARKYRHNFYARQAYVASVLRKGDMVREDLRSRMDEQVRGAPLILTLALPLTPTPLLTPTPTRPSSRCATRSRRRRRRRGSVSTTSRRSCTTCAPPPLARASTTPPTTSATTPPPSGYLLRSICARPSAR